MSTANKILYLGETKSLLKDTINMSNANITNSTTFRNYAQSLYDGYINVLKDRNTLLDNMPKETSTGTISEGLGLPIYENKMSKLSTQDGTPTPENPIEVNTVKGYRNLAYIGWEEDFVTRINDNTKAKIEVVDGRNCLFYTASAGYQEYDTKYLFKTNWKENTQYTISGYIKPSVANTTNLAVVYTDGTYTPINTTLSANNWEYFSYTTLSNKTIKYFRINWASGYCYLDLDTFMVYEGTQTLPYVPYGTNYIYTKIIGKNILNKKEIVSTNTGNWEVQQITSGVKINHKTSFSTGTPILTIKLQPNTTYIYSQKTNATSGDPGIGIKTTNGSYRYVTTGSITITTESDGIIIILFGTNLGNGQSCDYTDIQLEKGETATTYEPYQESIITIPLNNNEVCGIGDYKDEVVIDKLGNAKLVKNIGKVVLDGSETGWGTDTSGGYTNYKITLSSAMGSDTAISCLSQYFIGVTGNQSYQGSVDNAIGIGSSKALRIRRTTFEDVAALKTWLSTHNTDVYYVLATPTEIDLGTVNMELYEGTNNITNSEDMDMSIKYIKDTYE